MTVYEERTASADYADAIADRRAPTRGVRLSWASAQPYERMAVERPDLATPPLDGVSREPSAGADRRRAARVRAIRIRVVVADLVGSLVVLGICLWSWQSSTALFTAATLVATVAWLLALMVARGYDGRVLGDGPEEFQAILRAAVGMTAALGVVACTVQDPMPRRFLLVAIPLLSVLTALNHYAVRQWVHHQRSRGRQLRRTLVVGDGPGAERMIADLRSTPYLGLDVIGSCQQYPSASATDAPQTPVLGSLADIPQVVVDAGVDVVLVSSGGLTGPALRRLSWALERVGAELVVAPGLIEVAGPRVSVRPAAGLSLLYVEAPRPSIGRVIGKSVVDRTVGLAMFLCAVPVLAVSYLAVKATSSGPGFFAQRRVGLDGKTFVMWKLRSMVTDAEQVRQELLEQSDGNEVMFKMHDDPRITRVGKVLRRYSLDELPQLWNVVLGDMSLVGPRPSLPDEYALYRDAVHRRLRVKPGLTGLWQVSGRADLAWEEAVRLDLRYVDNWSMALDLQILWKTVRAVLRGSGAY